MLYTFSTFLFFFLRMCKLSKKHLVTIFRFCTRVERPLLNFFHTCIGYCSYGEQFRNSKVVCSLCTYWIQVGYINFVCLCCFFLQIKYWISFVCAMLNGNMPSRTAVSLFKNSAISWFELLVPDARKHQRLASIFAVNFPGLSWNLRVGFVIQAIKLLLLPT